MGVRGTWVVVVQKNVALGRSQSFPLAKIGERKKEKMLLTLKRLLMEGWGNLLVGPDLHRLVDRDFRRATALAGPGGDDAKSGGTGFNAV